MSPLEQRLRIAVLTRNYGRHKGGAENYAVSLAEQLAMHHDVEVFCQLDFNHHPNVKTHVMGFALQKPRWLNMLLYSAWTYWHTRRGFDIVHSHENVFHGNVQTFHVKPVSHNLFHHKNGVAFVLTLVKVMFSVRLLTYLAVEKARVRSPQKRLLITASQLLKDLYVQTFHLKPSEIQVLTPGVSNTQVTKTPIQALALKMAARRALALPLDKQVLLMVGHNYEKKGLGTLLQSLSYLKPDTVLVVVGDPDQIPNWRQKSDEWNVSDRVFFLGQQTNMEQVYQACDLFVHATLEDVFPIVVLEAMNHGLPVFVSPAPFCLSSNLLTHQQQAWVLKDPRDARELATAIEQVQANPKLSDALVENAKAFVQAYSWDRLAQEQMGMYHHLLQPSP